MTPEDFLGRVRALLPALRERAPRAEQLRRLPAETFADFQEAGLFRAMQPKRYGGFELDPEVFYQAITEVGAVCGSSGWVFGVVGVHNWHLALFPPQAQQDVWGEDDSLQLSTSLAPTGKVERVPGGFRLSGRWSFSSGCDFCDWAVLGGIAPPQEPGAPPDARTFLLPRGDYASFREQQQLRVNLRDGGRVAEDPFAQLRLAESAAEIDAAHDRMLANFAEMMRLARAGEEIPLALRARARWDAGKAVDWSVSAVDRLMMASGGRAIFLTNPIQRAWRDIHAMQAHAGTNLERAAAVFGRSEFGLPPTDIRF